MGVDKMEVVYQQEALSMGWCLDCHRDPARHLRPEEYVTVLDWQPNEDPLVFGQRLMEESNKTFDGLFDMPSIDPKNITLPTDSNETGKIYWRSLNELANTPEFQEFVKREIPNRAFEMLESSSRRRFLQVMAASFALAGLTGCRWPQEKIVPFSGRPEGRVPGVPEYFATAMELGGVASGLR